MAEESLDTAPTATAEDAILPDDSTTTDASSDDDTIVLDSETDESESAEETTSEDAEEASDDTESEDETTEDEADTDEPAVDPKEQARQAFLDRQAMKAQRQDEYATQLRDFAAQELEKIEDGTQRQLAELQVQNYVRDVADARNGLVIDNELVQRDFEVFNPKSENFNEKAYTEFLSDYEAAHVVKDAQGEVIGTKGESLYKYLSRKAELIGSLTQTGARQERKAESKMRAAAEVPSQATVKEPKKDSFLEAFDKEF